ncbi:MAG TPA: O-antigen ligase family protein [Gammaproteobacteria bacterium]|nr:O-antigen ligase family protein [Gammaproteobacteria bacterium]
MKKRNLITTIYRDYFNVPVFLWLALWAAINVGPWNLSGLFDGGMATLNGLRAIAPLLVMVVGGLLILSSNRPHRARITLPEALFWLYGLAMLAASLQIEPWFNTAYWGFSFIAVLVATRVFLHSEEPLRQITRLNYLTWAVAAIVLLMLLFFARDVLFEAETGYGVVNRASTVAGGAMSRATGMARFAAIPAVLAFVMFWRVNGWVSWITAAGVFAGSVSLVWFMQSRGALFSLAGTLVFVMLFMGKVPRVIAIVLFVLGLGGGLDMVPEQTQIYVVEHATRGTGVEGLKTMSGRDRIFRNAWQAIQEQPILGYGPQADRRIIGENAQNGLLYAWLSGGLPGMLGYVGGMLAAWWYFLKIIFGKFRMGSQARDMLIMTGGILAFFTLRSYPENTAALFSVDLLVQLPAMVYIAMLYRYLIVARQKQQQRKKVLKALKIRRYQEEPGTT